ncbi:MAG: hypothetical protein WDO73_21640 [Ignavibacteriota bacterium]
MSSRKIWLRPPVLLALCLVSVGGVVTLLGRLATGPAVAIKKVDLSTDVGAKAYPAFAPDGLRLAYSARGTSSKDETFHIFIRDVTGGAAQQMTTGPANDIGPVWSPDGKQIAFVRMSEGTGECVVIPDSVGGAERKFPGCTAPGDEARPMPPLSWMRDGQSLVVVQSVDGQPASLSFLSLSDGKFKPFTHAPAGAEDSTPAVAPDGNSIAFVRSTSPTNANIMVADSAGATPPHALTFDGRTIHGIAWTRDSRDVLYTGQRVMRWGLWRVPAYGGSPRDLLVAGREPTFVAVAPVGNRLVYTVSPMVSSIWRAQLGTSETVQEHAVIRSAGRENGPRYSPDGKTIADISDQTGNDEIWLSDADGANRVQVTSFKGPELARIRWSPDGKSLLFDASGEADNDLYTVPAAAGAKPVRVQAGAMNGSWSRDGKSIYFQARGQIWEVRGEWGRPTADQDVVQRGAARGIGGWEVHLFPQREIVLARADSRRRRRGGDRTRARVDVEHNLAADPSRNLLLRMGAQRSDPGSFILRLRFEEKFRDLQSAARWRTRLDIFGLT